MTAHPQHELIAKDSRPLTVRFSDQFLRKFATWLSDPLNRGSQPSEETVGLLFGAAGLSDCVVQNFRLLTADRTSETPAPASNLRQAFEIWQSQSTTDPELTWLDLLGWFCLRPASNGDLLPSDVEFHNACFPNPGSLAAVFHSPIENAIAAELYSSLPHFRFGAENHRRVSLHISFDSSGPAPTQPSVRPKIPDDMFLKAYEIAGALDRAERRAEWKEKVRSLLRFDWFRR